MAIHKKNDTTECGNYCGISIVVSHAGKVLLKVIARILSEYFGRKGLLPEEQSVFHPLRPTIDMMFVVRLLQELGRTAGVPLTSASSTFKRQVLSRFCMHPQIITTIREFHDGMKACVYGQAMAHVQNSLI